MGLCHSKKGVYDAVSPVPSPVPSPSLENSFETIGPEHGYKYEDRTPSSDTVQYIVPQGAICVSYASYCYIRDRTGHYSILHRMQEMGLSDTRRKPFCLVTCSCMSWYTKLPLKYWTCVYVFETLWKGCVLFFFKQLIGVGTWRWSL